MALSAAIKNLRAKPVIAQKVKTVIPKKAPPVKSIPVARPPAIGTPTFRDRMTGIDSSRLSTGIPAIGSPVLRDGLTPVDPNMFSNGVIYPSQPPAIGAPTGGIGGGQLAGRVEQNYRGIPGLVNATAPTPNFGPITSPAQPTRGMPAMGGNPSSGVIYPNQPAMGAPSSFYGSIMGGLFGGQPNMTQFGGGGIGYPMGYPAQQPVGGGLFGQPMTQFGNGGIGYPMGYPAQQPNMGQPSNGMTQYSTGGIGYSASNTGQQYATPNINQQPQNFGNAGFSAPNTNTGQQQPQPAFFDSFAYRPL